MINAAAIRWSLRRLSLPVAGDALVLEVGSGGNPYPRANVLLDAYEETRERHWAPLVVDRPTVLAFGERLPFKDKAFDFVVAAHVLEHSAEPERFLNELQRVGRAGYIETPDAFMERINPYRDHRLEITVREGELLIRRKPAWVVDADLVELYEPRVKGLLTQRVIPANPEAFHVRYFWKDRIRFRVLNSNVNASWMPPLSDARATGGSGAKAAVRDTALRTMRALFSQRGRNRRLDLLGLLKCPRCDAERFSRNATHVVCAACGAKYEQQGAVIRMST